MKLKRLFLFAIAIALVIIPAVAMAEDKAMEDYAGQYESFTGLIESLEQEGNKTTILVNIDGDIENQMIVHIGKNIPVMDMTDTRENKLMHLEKGAEVQVFYDKNTPIALSLPGQMMNPSLVLVKNGDYFAKYDIFNDALISSDNQLKLNIEDNSEAEEYKNSLLLVFYKESSKSIPSITKPYRVFKFDSPKEEDVYEIDLTIRDGIGLFPLRQVLEDMGYEVVWNGKDKPIEVKKEGKVSRLILGDKSYEDFEETRIELKAAPILIKEKTYIPVSYLEKILKMENIEVKDGVLNIR